MIDTAAAKRSFAIATLVFAWGIGTLAAQAQSKQSEQFGNIRLNIPQGWASQPEATAAILMPMHLKRGDAALIAVSRSQKLTDLDAQFNQFVKNLHSKRSIVKLGGLISGTSPEGYSVRRQEKIVRTSDGGTDASVYDGSQSQ